MKESQEKLLKALEDNRYKWRTIEGITTQTELSADEVEKLLYHLIKKEVVIRSELPSVKGQELFTTRNHFKRTTPLSKRLGAAFRNRAK